MSIALQFPAFVAPRSRGVRASAPITVYGSWRKLRDLRIRRFLTRAGVEFQHVDLDVTPDARPNIPALSLCSRLPVVFVDGDWLEAPTIDDLRECLQAHGLLGNEPR